MKKITIIIGMLIFLVFPLLNLSNVQATAYSDCIVGKATEDEQKECCGLEGSENVAFCKNTINILQPTGAIPNISNVISGAVKLIIVVAGLIAFVYLLLGGIKWITSGGDSAAVETARNQIIQALIGIIVVLAAWALIVLVENATGACFGFSCPFKLDGIFLPQ